jgi:hypothetical protein
LSTEKQLFPTPLPHSQVKGTFWLETNEEELENEIPFDELERMFCAKPPKEAANAGTVLETKKKKEEISVLEPQKARNLAITLGSIKMEPADVRAALLELNMEKLDASHVESFLKLAPSDEEARELRIQPSPAHTLHHFPPPPSPSPPFRSARPWSSCKSLAKAAGRLQRPTSF